MPGESEQGTVRFVYEVPDNYAPTYANGAFGGVTPKGEIVVNFFFERHGIPFSHTFQATPEGMLGPEVARHPASAEPTFIRSIQVGVIMTTQHAKAVHEWLGGLIERAEESGHSTKQGSGEAE